MRRPAALLAMVASRRARSCAAWALLAAAWFAAFGPTLLAHAHRTFHPSVLQDDMRIVLPYFYHYRDARLFAHDPIARYHADGTGDLFRVIYVLAAKLSDVVVVAKAVTYVAFLLTIAGLAVAARRVAGLTAAVATAGIAAGSFVFFDRIAGGLPRAFAYPLFAWSAAALAAGKIRTLAVLGVVGAGFYPVVPVVNGLTLAVVLLVLPRADRGSARTWSWRRRVAVLALTAAATAAMIAPFALRMAPYGRVLRPHDAALFPEIGPGGRHGVYDRSPSPPFFELATGVTEKMLFGEGRPFAPSLERRLLRHGTLHDAVLQGLAWLTLLGIARLGFRAGGGPVRRLAAFALAVFGAFVLAELVSPTLVLGQRYVRFAVPVLVALAVPCAARGLLPRRARLPGRLRRFTRPLWVLGYGLLLLAGFGARGTVSRAFTVVLKRDDRRVEAAIAHLPKDAVVAGWPRGVLDEVPLVTHRSALITGQMFMPYHLRMTELMRARVEAIIDAYYSTDRGALLSLSRKFGATHLLIEPELLPRPDHLWKPFSTEIRHRFAALHKRHARSALAGSFGDAVVFADEHYELVDLRRLGAAH